MSFDRPGLPLPGQKAEEVEITEDLRAEGLELNPDGELDGLDREGAVSAGPQPNPPRRPHEAVVQPPETVEPAEVDQARVDESEEPVDDPAHEDPTHS